MSMSAVLTGIMLACMGGALLQEVNALFARERQHYHRHYKRDLILVDVIAAILYGLASALVGLIYVSFGNEPLVIYGALAVLGTVEIVLFARHCLQRGNSTNRLGIVLLPIWLGVVLYLTLFSRLGGGTGSKVMSTPFLGFSQALEQRSLKPRVHFALNMLLFMPLGYLLPNIDPGHLRRGI